MSQTNGAQKYDNQYGNGNQDSSKADEDRDILEYLRSMGIFQKISALIEPPMQQTEELKKKLHVLQMRIEQNFPFTDTTFPPSDISIAESKNNLRISWSRLSQIVKREQLRFLVQGKPIDFIKSSSIIDDRYVLSALNILLTKMDMIVRNFEITEINSAGIFGFWVNQAGQWDLMVLDDNFPMKNEEYCMAITNNGIWLMVLEKALAKMYGNYSSLNGGFTQNILTDLTGAPSELIGDGTAQEWSELIDSWIKRGFLVFAENERNIHSQSVLENSGFSFSVLAIENVGQEIIVKLKSPINQVFFEGEWRNSSSKWTSSLRGNYEVSMSPSSDGTFWMSIQEFRDSFQFLGNLRTHENYVYKWMNIDHAGRNQSLIKFTIEQSTHMYIILHQDDERNVTKVSPNFEYPCTRIIVAKINNSSSIKTYDYVGSNYLSSREIFIEDVFTPGEYLITVEIYWVQNNDRLFTVSFYGESVPSKVAETDTSNLLDIQKQIISRLSLTAPLSTQKIRDYSNNGEPQIKVFNDIIAGIVYFVYQNKGTKRLREKVEMVELENLIICKPYENSSQYEVQVSPGNETIVFYKYNPFGEKFSFNCKIKAGLDPIVASAVVSKGIEGHERVENSNAAQGTYQSQSMFDSQGVRNAKSIKFGNNNMRNSKVQMIVNRHDLAEENGTSNFSQVDLIKIMKSNASPAKRMWKEKEIGVFVYHYQHAEGTVILIQNLGSFQYEEVLTFNLQNLSIENPQEEVLKGKLEIDYNNSKVRVLIDPGSHQFIFLGVVKKAEPFAFKISSLYQYHQN